MLRKKLLSVSPYPFEQHDFKIKLNQNESPFDLPAAMKKRLLDRVRKIPWNRYPTAYGDRLRLALSKREKWDPRGIVVYNGSNALIHHLVGATAVRGKMLTVRPTFSLYKIEGEIFENRVIEVPLNPLDFSLPIDRFLRKLRQARPNLVILANPNAPTGNLFPKTDLIRIIQAAKRIGTIVVVDEAYYPFSGQTLRPVLKRFPNLVLLRTFSKAFSLAGIRVGYLLASPPLVEEFRRATLPFVVGTIAEEIALGALTQGSYVESVRKTILHERQKLIRGLRKIRSVCPYRSDTNFILFKVADANRVFERLAKKGILIRPMAGHGLKDCLRVSVGTPAENARFLKALRGH